MNSDLPHVHKGKVWEIFPCFVTCDGKGEVGDVEMIDCWQNRYFFHAFNVVIVNLMIHVCGIEQPGFKIYLDNPHNARKPTKKG